MSNRPSESKVHSKATITDVARCAGVSITTVSRYINQSVPVAEKTGAKIQAAILELKFLPSVTAKNLASKRTNTIGLLLPDISSDFFPPMLRGIDTAARENDFRLLISVQGEKSAELGQSLHLGNHNTDGLIIFTDSLTEMQLTWLYNLKFPMVLLYQSPPNSLNIPHVAFENQLGSLKIVEHLIEVHNCRRIAYLRGAEGHEDSHWREMGYRKALQSHNIPFDQTLMEKSDFSEEIRREWIEKCIEDDLNIDAVFAGDDRTAFHVITTLKKVGKRVPEDIAVVGFDDLPISRHLTPPLTTVRAPIETAGYEATKQLISLIHNDPVELLTLLPTELAIRRSCGCKYQEVI